MRSRTAGPSDGSGKAEETVFYGERSQFPVLVLNIGIEVRHRRTGVYADTYQPQLHRTLHVIGPDSRR